VTLPKNLAESLQALATPDLGHDELAGLALSILGEMKDQPGEAMNSKIKAVELLLKIQQDKRAADPDSKADAGTALLAAIARIKGE
jgi:hypothetical protein